jgi:hypothetical protein
MRDATATFRDKSSVQAFRRCYYLVRRARRGTPPPITFGLACNPPDQIIGAPLTYIKSPIFFLLHLSSSVSTAPLRGCSCLQSLIGGVQWRLQPSLSHRQRVVREMSGRPIVPRISTSVSRDSVSGNRGSINRYVINPRNISGGPVAASVGFQNVHSIYLDYVYLRIHIHEHILNSVRGRSYVV